MLQRATERNPDLVSQPFRRLDADKGVAEKAPVQTQTSSETLMTVPIRASDKPYGCINH